MSIAKKLTEWQNAKLLSADQVNAIRAYEEIQPSATRFLWQYGLFGLGILIIALGLMAMVGAHWDEIPSSLKLIGHIALNVTAITLLFQHWRHNDTARLRFEGLLLINATLVLTLMALIGQIFNITSTLEHTMLVWWCLIIPMLLWLGQHRASLIMAITLTSYVLGSHLPQMSVNYHPTYLFYFLTIAFVQLCALLPMFSVWRMHKPRWIETQHNFAMIVMLVTLSVQMIWPFGGLHTALYPNDTIPIAAPANQPASLRYAWEIAVLLNILFCVVLGGFKYRATTIGALWHTCDGWLRVTLLHLGLALVSGLLPAWFGWFILYWLIMGYVGLKWDDRRLVSIAVSLIAIRIIVLYVELFDNLFANGLMMVISGIVLIKLIKTYPRWRAAILRLTGDLS